MKKSNILFIDDEEILASKIKQILEFEDYVVHYESSGITALEYLKNNIPDLIICDITMPEMDGFEFYEEFQSLNYLDVPFIFLTANNKLNDFRKGMSLGADDYLTKPISRANLLEAIQIRLKKRNSQNENLTIAIKEYSTELMKRDLCLQGIAHNQAHDFREPIATLMAVISLIDSSNMDSKNKELIRMLSPLAEKIDKAIRENVYTINTLTVGAK